MLYGIWWVVLCGASYVPVSGVSFSYIPDTQYAAFFLSFSSFFHTTQVILCAIYGVCKINQVKPEVTFKRIIEGYKQIRGGYVQTEH